MLEGIEVILLLLPNIDEPLVNDCKPFAPLESVNALDGIEPPIPDAQNAVPADVTPFKFPKKYAGRVVYSLVE